MQTSSDSATRILLVEDDEDDYILTRDLLDSVPDYRYSLEWVAGYDDALATIRFKPYDVCLLDNRLGEQNGIDLLTAIGEVGAPMPIIMLTGIADRHVDESAMRAGVSDFLVKDKLSPELLERVIRFSIDRYRLTAKLELLAKYDSLTGFANRMLFQDFLAGAIGRADRGSRQLGLMFLDLDFFKYINDTYGHLAGDELLVEVANRLKSCVRTGDVVARLGGDEFAIVLDDIGSVANAPVAAENVLDALKKPFNISSQKIQAHASIGVALYSKGYGTPAKLINAADTAMYEAKNNGHNGYRIFSWPTKEGTDTVAQLERTLAEDIESNKISIHFQPQIDVRTGLVSGVEALAQWNEQSPSDFIPAAERSGLIIQLGDRLLRRACIHFGHWRRSGLVLESTRLAVNISAVQLKGDHFIRSVKDALKDSGLPAEALELELTETAVVDDPDNAVAILNQLHCLGVRIALDDFGTGYSSLTHLKTLPIRALKIDRSFVKDIGIDGRNETLIKAIIGLANNLGLDMVAEGVETEAQAEFLIQCGCQYMQGWLFSRAIPAEELMDRLENGALVNTQDFRINFGGEKPRVVSLTAWFLLIADTSVSLILTTNQI